MLTLNINGKPSTCTLEGLHGNEAAALKAAWTEVDVVPSSGEGADYHAALTYRTEAP